MSSPDSEADEICAEHDVQPLPPLATSKVGIALNTLHLDPLNGMRIAPEGDTCGWYIWGGEPSDADDFFQPSHVSHLRELCPRVVPYLSLPPGFRFVLGKDDYEDVWHDPDLR